MVSSTPGDDGRAAETGTETANRVADVLLLFGGEPRRLGVSAISRRLGLSKAVVHRILRSLVSRQLLATDPGLPGYRIGPAAVALGSSALNQFQARAVAAPVLRALRERTDETATLSWLVEDERMYIDQYESGQEIKMTVPVGTRYPLHAGASGKVILAHLAEDRREAVLARPLAALTSATPTDPVALRAELAEIARTGVAVTRGERQSGAGSVAVALLGPDGTACGAISVCGPEHRFTPHSCASHGDLVRAAAEEIQRALR